MSSIAGIYKENGEPVRDSELQSMLDALHHWDADDRSQLVDGPVGLGHLMLYNTPESKYERLPYRALGSGLIITADARIDNREELFQKMDITADKDKPVTDSRLILEAYKKWGMQCPNFLVGAFAFAIWDTHNNHLFCARDHMGFKPFHYYYHNGLFIFSTESRGVLAHPEVSAAVNELFVADALATLKSEKDRTFYNEIFRLPPAHWIQVSPEITEFRRYWEPDPHYELKLPSEEEYIKLFREKLEEAVRCRLRSAYPVGAELSGGIDSSTIVGLAAREGNIKAFSHALPEWAKDQHFPYDDETRYSRMVTEYHNIREHHLVTGEREGILEPLRKGLRLHKEVMQGTLSAIFEPLYRKVEQENCRTLLSGYGGDEMVTSRGAGYMQELAGAYRYEKLLKELRKKNRGKGALKTAKQFAKNTIVGIAGKFQPAYKTPKWAHDIYHALAIDPSFFEEINLKKRFYSKKKLPAGCNVRMRQSRRINYDYMPRRLEYCAIQAQTHKAEYRYPLLDKRLVEFYLSLPSSMKFRNGYGRYILRKATEGILPPEIQWRTDKTGVVVPSIFLRWKQDEKAIRDLILRAKESNIKHYVDYDKMLDMLEKIVHRDTGSRERVNPQAFQSSVMLLLYQLNE
jgi:asparagine synthase (glutamine-hydrolysing)